MERSGSTGSFRATAGCCGGVLHQRQIDRGSQNLRRRREVSRVAGVERGAVKRLPGQAEARAELVGVDILIHLVEPQPGVQGQVIGDLPLVLKIGAEQPAGFAAGIEDGEWRIDRIAAHWIDRQHGGNVGDQRAFALTENPKRSVWA